MSPLGWLTPLRAVRLFAAANIAFLGVDIGLAHLANDYARPAEWLPLVFSAVATLLLLPGAIDLRRPAVAHLDRLVGAGAVLLGVAGMVLHLESGFFAAQTLRHLVYSAPFLAPVSYVGVGLLLLLSRSPEAASGELGPWVLTLALGGFVGNFGLSVLDHAQNGFFHPTEWIPVASAALAVGFLAVGLWTPGMIPRRVSLGVMALQVAIGLLGFGLHLAADFGRGGAARLDRFVFGAPPFAPLLFANLALLAVIGLWADASGAPTGASAAPGGHPGGDPRAATDRPTT